MRTGSVKFKKKKHLLKVSLEQSKLVNMHNSKSETMIGMFCVMNKTI